MLISMETFTTCDFPGGCPDLLSPLDPPLDIWVSFAAMTNSDDPHADGVLISAVKGSI